MKIKIIMVRPVIHFLAGAPAAVGMGNPHCIFFVADAEAVDLAVLGPAVENHPLFPDRTNVEFIEVLGENRLRMRVWERGAGITQACGSGACAAVVAAARRAGAEIAEGTRALEGFDALAKEGFDLFED